MPHLIISDEQIEGIVRFYAASATCQGDKLKWTPTCQGTNCGARMFPGFLLNLSLFLSLAGGQLGVGPLSHGCAVPASRLPPRVLSASGRRPAPTDAAAETGRWATSHRDVAAPKGGAKSRLPLWGRCHAFGMTERARCQRPLRMGCVEALASCPLSRLTAPAPPEGEPSLASPFGGRWCPVGTVQRLVSAAASVGDGRSPLGCITRAGRRECPRRGRRGPTKSCPPAEDRKV